MIAHDNVSEQNLELKLEGRPQDLLVFLRNMEDSRPLCIISDITVEPGNSSELVRASLVLTRLWREV